MMTMLLLGFDWCGWGCRQAQYLLRMFHLKQAKPVNPFPWQRVVALPISSAKTYKA